MLPLELEINQAQILQGHFFLVFTGNIWNRHIKVPKGTFSHVRNVAGDSKKNFICWTI